MSVRKNDIIRCCIDWQHIIQNCTIINNINTVTTTAAATGYTTALDLLRMGRVNII